MNDELKHVTKAVEGPDFRFTVNLAAGLRSLKHTIYTHESFKTLQELIAPNDECALDLLIRVYDLASMETDNRYEHPYDTALAAYLLAFESVGSRYVLTAAQSLLNTPRLWWAKKIAHEVLASSKQKTPSTDVLYVTQHGKSLNVYPQDKTVAVRDFISWKHLHTTRVDRLVFLDVGKAQAVPLTVHLADKLIASRMEQDLQHQLWPKDTVFVVSSALETGDIHEPQDATMERLGK